MMKYPNLVWAIEKKRLAHYELSAEVKIERTRFSRCLHGAASFTSAELTRIGEALGYTAEWLFAEPRPAARRMLDAGTAQVAPAIACTARE
jgi:hypothetical protein